MSVHHRLVRMQAKSVSTLQERPFVTANQETMKFKITVLEVCVNNAVCVLTREWYTSITYLSSQSTSFLSDNVASSKAELFPPIFTLGFEVFNNISHHNIDRHLKTFKITNRKPLLLDANYRKPDV